MKLQDLEILEHPSPCFDSHRVVLFPNGYGASIVTGENAYGNSKCPYELAVIYTEEDIPEVINGNECINKNYVIDYSHSDGDVVGYLNEEMVNKWLSNIEKY